MSSFIHSAKHFNSIQIGIINVLSRRTPSFHAYPLTQLYSKLTNIDAYNKKEVIEQIKNIVNILAKINVLTVSLQYKSHYEGVLDNEIKEQTQKLLNRNINDFKPLSDAGLLQAIQSYEYQVEIEHLTELRELTTDETKALQFIKTFKAKLCEYIVEQSEDYKNNGEAWSI